MLGELCWHIVALAGLAGYFHARRVGRRRALGLRGAPRIGALTQGVLLYFAILPPLFGVELASAVFCKLIHIESSQQPVADLFLATDSMSLVLLITGFAVIVAPVLRRSCFVDSPTPP